MNMQPIHVKAKSQHHFYKEILVVFCLFHMWVLLRLHINSSNFGTNRTKLFAFHANSPLAQQELSIFRTLLQQHRQYNSDLQAKKKALHSRHTSPFAKLSLQPISLCALTCLKACIKLQTLKNIHHKNKDRTLNYTVLISRVCIQRCKIYLCPCTLRASAHCFLHQTSWQFEEPLCPQQYSIFD